MTIHLQQIAFGTINTERHRLCLTGTIDSCDKRERSTGCRHGVKVNNRIIGCFPVHDDMGVINRQRYI